MNETPKKNTSQEIALAANPYATRLETQPSHGGASAGALVNREAAEVQGAIMMAKRFPRDQRAAVDRIIMACTRPTLAEIAMYDYPRGGQKVTGPSIRLAEAMVREWGNIACGVVELFRHDGASECLAYAWDMETNFRDEKRFTVNHVRDTKQGPKPLTDERDIYEMIANMGARRKRACILALIPGDVQDAAISQCHATLLAADKEVTPERLKKLAASFGEYGVTVKMIEARIRRNIDATTPQLLVQLGKIYNSLKDGMSKPEDWFDLSVTESERPTREDFEKSAAAKKETAKKATKPDKAAAPETEQELEEAKAEESETEPKNQEEDTTDGVSDTFDPETFVSDFRAWLVDCGTLKEVEGLERDNANEIEMLPPEYRADLDASIENFRNTFDG